MLYGIGTGLKDGWLVMKWSHFLHNIGFTSIDPKKPLNVTEFIIEQIDTNSQD